MSEAAAAHLEKAFRDLRAARLLLEGDEAEASVNCAYYAAMVALELVENARKPTRAPTDRFWGRFVEEEKFPRPLGKFFFFRARVMREGAYYDAFTRFDTVAGSNPAASSFALQRVNAVRRTLGWPIDNGEECCRQDCRDLSLYSTGGF